MHVIAGLLLILALLYFWLIGHWFARAVAFLMLALVCGGAGWLVGLSMHPEPTPAEMAAAKYYVSFPADEDVLRHYVRQHQSTAPEVIMVLLGIALAWPLSGLPVYYRRHQLGQRLTLG